MNDFAGFKPFYREYLTDEQLYLDAAWPDHMICLEVDGPHHFLPGELLLTSNYVYRTSCVLVCPKVVDLTD